MNTPVPFHGVSVDPGVIKGHGVACWEGGELRHAYLLKADGMITDWDEAHGTLAIEIPVVRDTGLQSGRQKDIVNLAVAAGGLIGRHQHLFKHIVEVYPESWGGQTPADIKIMRILERLSDTEKKRIRWPSTKKLREDVIAAIGIGYYVFSPSRSLVRRGR